MLSVKIVSLFFSFLYVLSLQFVDGEAAREIVQFNALVIIGSIVVRLFGDIYYISKPLTESPAIPFRISVVDLVSISAITPVLVLTDWAPYDAPPALAGSIIAVHCLSIIAARYLQRTGAPKTGFLLINVPYFSLAAPAIVLIGDLNYSVMLFAALIHLAICGLVILARGIWRLELEARLHLHERLQQSAALFTGAIVNQGGLFLIAETLPSQHVADMSLFYRVTALTLIPLMTFSMGRQIKHIDERETLQFQSVYADYLLHARQHTLVLAAATLVVALSLIALIARGNPSAPALLILLFYGIKIASGPLEFFTVISTGHGILIALVTVATSLVAFGATQVGVSGALALPFAYAGLNIIFLSIVARSNRLFARPNNGQ